MAKLPCRSFCKNWERGRGIKENSLSGQVLKVTSRSNGSHFLSLVLKLGTQILCICLKLYWWVELKWANENALFYLDSLNPAAFFFCELEWILQFRKSASYIPKSPFHVRQHQLELSKSLWNFVCKDWNTGSGRQRRNANKYFIYFFWTAICFVCAIYSKCVSSFHYFIIAYTSSVLLHTVMLICSLGVCSVSWLQELEETASHFFHLSSINECLIRRFISFVYSLDQDFKLGHKIWWQISLCSFKG